MATIKKDDVLTYLEKANMLEVSELIADIEEKFGVTAAAPVAVAAAGGGGGGEEAAAEKTEFNVVLTEVGSQKIQVIKAEVAELHVMKVCKHQYRYQHQHASYLGKQEKLHRCVILIFVTPDGDDEIHRNQHDFPEEEEQE